MALIIQEERNLYLFANRGRCQTLRADICLHSGVCLLGGGAEGQTPQTTLNSSLGSLLCDDSEEGHNVNFYAGKQEKESRTAT